MIGAVHASARTMLESYDLSSDGRTDLVIISGGASSVILEDRDHDGVIDGIQYFSRSMRARATLNPKGKLYKLIIVQKSLTGEYRLVSKVSNKNESLLTYANRRFRYRDCSPDDDSSWSIRKLNKSLTSSIGDSELDKLIDKSCLDGVSKEAKVRLAQAVKWALSEEPQSFKACIFDSNRSAVDEKFKSDFLSARVDLLQKNRPPEKMILCQTDGDFKCGKADLSGKKIFLRKEMLDREIGQCSLSTIERDLSHELLHFLPDIALDRVEAETETGKGADLLKENVSRSGMELICAPDNYARLTLENNRSGISVTPAAILSSLEQEYKPVPVPPEVIASIPDKIPPLPDQVANQIGQHLEVVMGTPQDTKIGTPAAEAGGRYVQEVGKVFDGVLRGVVPTANAGERATEKARDRTVRESRVNEGVSDNRPSTATRKPAANVDDSPAKLSSATDEAKAGKNLLSKNPEPPKDPDSENGVRKVRTRADVLKERAETGSGNEGKSRGNEGSQDIGTAGRSARSRSGVVDNGRSGGGARPSSIPRSGPGSSNLSSGEVVSARDLAQQFIRGTFNQSKGSDGTIRQLISISRDSEQLRLFKSILKSNGVSLNVSTGRSPAGQSVAGGDIGVWGVDDPKQATKCYLVRLGGEITPVRRGCGSGGAK